MAINKIKTNSLDNTAVSNAKLGADAVDATKIADDAVSEEHLDVTAITGHTELAATAEADDVVLIFDTSASAIKKIQRSNLTLQAPTFSSISPSNANSGDGTGNHTLVITGTKFDSAPTVKFRGNDASLISASSTTRNSATQLTVVVAKSSLPDSNEPYDISITNANGLGVETTSNPLNINASPVYVTSAGTLGTVNGGASVDISVNATDPESAGNVTFEIQSGALPAGLTLTNTAAEGGTAKITGTATNPSGNTTSNFVLRAVDAASNTTSRAFSITVNRVFTSTSFTSSGTFAVPSGTSQADVLVVAGGGAGGTHHGGGGGAGGLVFMPAVPLTPGGTVAITVGCGGGQPNNYPAPDNPDGQVGATGQDSVFGASPSPGTSNPLTAKGGGGGGAAPGNALSGGSGGGGRGSTNCSAGGSATQPTQSGDSGAYGFGNAGGPTPSGLGPQIYQAGGGGGAAQAGCAGGGPSIPGNAGEGGNGKAYTIADGTTSVYYAGGGGGSRYNNNQPTTTDADGGQGGGGDGGGMQENNFPARTGTANRGGGGGGADRGPGPSGAGGGGGKGIVVVRF